MNSRRLEQFDDHLARFEKGVLLVSVLTLVSLSFFQIVFRNFLHSGIQGLELISRLLVLWITFLGASLATARKRHIAIDAVSRLLPSSHARGLAFFTQVFGGVVSLFLAKAAIDFVSSEYAAGLKGAWGIPSWIFPLVIPFGFFLMGLRFFLRAFLDISSEHEKTKGSQ